MLAIEERPISPATNWPDCSLQIQSALRYIRWLASQQSRHMTLRIRAKLFN